MISVPTNGETLFLQSWSSKSEDWASQALSALLKTKAKKNPIKTTECFCLFFIPISQMTIMYQSNISLHLLLAYFKKPYLSDTRLDSFNSIYCILLFIFHLILDICQHFTVMKPNYF